MQHILKRFICALIYCALAPIISAFGQDECPANIGFEKGDFSNWKCYTGSIAPGTGILDISTLGEGYDRHTIIPSTSTQLDPFGKFPVICPNGSNYSVKLGNSSNGRGAEKLTYTFTVPANAPDYTLIYNYAVVFQNPGHTAEVQPKFTVNVFDNSTNQPIGCGSHDFTATGNLPGFQNGPSQTVFKPWTPVSINFLGYSGKTIRIEFATNDCAPGGHFGYAYVDVNENCSSPITGNTICPGTIDHVTLTAPAGFKEYYWYNSDFSTVLSTQTTLTISPPPPLNTIYALRIVPYPELGCLDTVYTSINAFNGNMVLNVPSVLTACRDVGVDLTDSLVTVGSSPKSKYSYYLDAQAITFLTGAKSVKTSGTYYIKATNPSGCFLIKPVQIIISDPPNLIVASPPSVCKPGIVDITLPSVTAGSTIGIILSYWLDLGATVPVLSPKNISSSGTYYIKASTSNSCYIIKSISVVLVDMPQLVANNVKACYGEAVTEATVTAGSTPGLIFSFYSDAAYTIDINSISNIKTSGTYYVKAANTAGCTLVAHFDVTVYQDVNLIVGYPLIKVDYPVTADLTSVITPVTGLTYTYWTDPQCTKPLLNPNSVDANGYYYVKAENANKCSKVATLKVEIVPPPLPLVNGTNTFTPNADGTNDVFKMEVTGFIRLNYFKVFDRWGQLAFYSREIGAGWDGKKGGKDVPTGTYYWTFDGYDDYYKQKVSNSGSVTLIR